MGDVRRVFKNDRFIGWYIRYVDANGVRRQRASHQTNEVDARKMLEEIEATVARGNTRLAWKLIKQAQPGKTESVVYFVRANDEIKIGTTRDPESRVQTIQTGNAAELELLAAVPGNAVLEKSLHHRFQHLRIRGEWFRSAPELVFFIEGLQLGLSGAQRLGM